MLSNSASHWSLRMYTDKTALSPCGLRVTVSLCIWRWIWLQSVDPVLQSFAAMGWREIAGVTLLLYGCFNAHLAATSILLGEILLEVSETFESRLFPSVELQIWGYRSITFQCTGPEILATCDIRSGPVSIRDSICLQCPQVSLREVHTRLLLHILRGSDGWCSSCLCSIVGSFNPSHIFCAFQDFFVAISQSSPWSVMHSKHPKQKKNSNCLDGCWNNIGHFWFLNRSHDSMDSMLTLQFRYRNWRTSRWERRFMFPSRFTWCVPIRILTRHAYTKGMPAMAKNMNCIRLTMSLFVSAASMAFWSHETVTICHHVVIEYNAERSGVSRGEDSDRHPWPCLCWRRQRQAVILLHLSSPSLNPSGQFFEWWLMIDRNGFTLLCFSRAFFCYFALPSLFIPFRHVYALCDVHVMSKDSDLHGVEIWCGRKYRNWFDTVSANVCALWQVSC